MASKYAHELPANDVVDGRILAALSVRSMPFTNLCLEVIPGFAKKPARFDYAALDLYDAKWRQVDRRLQALRKAGKVRFVDRAWSLVR